MRLDKPSTLIKSGVALLALSLVSRVILADVLVNIDQYMNPSPEQNLGLISNIVNVVSEFTLPLGCSLIGAGLVIRALRLPDAPEPPDEID